MCYCFALWTGIRRVRNLLKVTEAPSVRVSFVTTVQQPWELSCVPMPVTLQNVGGVKAQVFRSQTAPRRVFPLEYQL